MIKLSGVLTIRRIDGRNGPFNVGRLATEIGEFAVKDALIEEYDEGKYEGDFGIGAIYPAHYVAGGRLVVEVRARLETISLAGIDELPQAEAAPMTEPDPIDERPVVVEPGPQAVEAPAEEASGTDEDQDLAETDPDARLAELFGTLWPLGADLKLDPTVDRARFRQQRDALKELGFRFQPVGQSWIKQAD